MLPFQISSSFFEQENSISEMSEMSDISDALPRSSTGFSLNDSGSFISPTSSAYDSVAPTKKVSCYFYPCQRQSFSIPEKIVYYMATNVTNAETYQKLVETCKYFFKANPIIVVPKIDCYDRFWHGTTYHDANLIRVVDFKYNRPKKFKIWVTQEFNCLSGSASHLIPWIYKNDAEVVYLQSEPFKFEEFLLFAGNAKELKMLNRLVKYEDGKTVQFEDIVANLPKLKSLTFAPCFDGSDVSCNTVRKLMELEHFKHLTTLNLYHVPEVLDIKEMYKYICENKHIQVVLWYRPESSDAYKELIQKYSNRLKNEEGCYSRIGFNGMNYATPGALQSSSSEDNSSDTSFVSSDDDENDDLVFPWNNEDEEWKLPWDKID